MVVDCFSFLLGQDSENKAVMFNELDDSKVTKEGSKELGGVCDKKNQDWST
ncbi:hypothetical protein J6590_060189 [Homalodisca vitripennis]|nr:hypothetical protein J6590_060189 [Homalodisca vitripennis]